MPNGICYFISFIVEAITIWMYAETLFLPKYTKQMRISMFAFLILPLFLISLLEKTWLNTIIFPIALFLFFLSSYGLRWYIAFFHSLVITALVGMTELFFIGICNFLNPYFLTGKREFYAILQFTILSKLFYFSVLFMLIHTLRKRQYPRQTQDKSIFLLFLVPLISLGMLLAFVYYNDKISAIPELNGLATICSSCLLLLNLLVFGINQYNQKRHQEYVEMQLLCQKETDTAEYYRALVAQNESQRVLIHDIRKHLTSIDALAETGEPGKIRTYIRELQ